MMIARTKSCPVARSTRDAMGGAELFELGRRSAGLLKPLPLGVPLLQKLDFLELIAGLVEVGAGRCELGREARGRGRQVVASLDGRLGEGRVSVMVDVGDA
jgi:hypothetical protein